jgi:hypothetical protein
MSEFTEFPIPSVEVSDEAAAIRAAIGAETPAGAVTTARRRRPALPQVLGRIAELRAAGDTLNIYMTGDSLSDEISSEFRDYVHSGIGVIGWAFEWLITSTISGTVSGITTDPGTAGKTKFWETGRINVLSAGASVAIGRRETGSVTLQDMLCDKFTLYLGREVGNGTATISVSYDGGATWQADIETVDTSHTETGVLVKSYTLAATRLTRVRVVAADGPVQIIGAKMWDSTAVGAIMGMTGRDGATLAQYSASSSQAIRNAVMADFAPHLITGQFSESVAEIAALQGWVDKWMIAAPNADFLFTNIYDIGNRDKATYTDVINAHYDAIAAANPRFFVHDLAATFKDAAYLNAAGFHPLNAADVHLPSRSLLAWKAAACEMAAFMGLYTPKTTYAPKRSGATAATLDYRALPNTTGNAVNIIERYSTAVITKIMEWFDPALGRGSWRMRRRAGSDSNAAWGLDFRNDMPGGSALTWCLIDQDGCIKLGNINTGSTSSASTDGFRLVAIGTTTTQSAADFAVSASGTADIVRFRKGSTQHGRVTSAGAVYMIDGFHHGADGAGPRWKSGAGTPEGAITAPVGSIYSRTDGGAGTSFYVKESGTGNTGWVAK